jgi:hypothetical protein
MSRVYEMMDALSRVANGRSISALTRHSFLPVKIRVPLEHRHTSLVTKPRSTTTRAGFFVVLFCLRRGEDESE